MDVVLGRLLPFVSVLGRLMSVLGDIVKLVTAVTSWREIGVRTRHKRRIWAARESFGKPGLAGERLACGLRRPY